MSDFEKSGKSKDIENLIKELNKDPEILQLDYTPAVYKLIEHGLEAALAILPLLNSTDNWERHRAQRVLEGVIQNRFGWKPGYGYPDGSKGEEKVKNLLVELGNYQAEGSIKQRLSSIKKWKDWLQKQIRIDEKK